MRRHALRCPWPLAVLLACTAPPESPPPPIVYKAAEVGPPIEVQQPTIAPGVPIPPPRPVDPALCASPDPSAPALQFVPDVYAGLPERFDPSGRFAASSGGDGCDVWALDSGDYLGRFGGRAAWPSGGDPCSAWSEIIELDLRADQPLDDTLKAGELELVIEGELVRALADGEERYRFSSEGGDYIEASVSPDHARLAIAHPQAIELRELDHGTLLARLSLEQPEPPAFALSSLVLFWSRAMPVALIGRKPCPPDIDQDDCEWSNAAYEDELIWELRRWVSPSAKVVAELVTWEGEDYPGWIGEAHVDPLGRWLWAHMHMGSAHDSPWARRQIPLTEAAEAADVDFSAEGVDEREDLGFNRFGITEHADVRGSWLSGARTARVWSISESSYDGEGNGSDDLWWASLQLWPRAVASGAHELASDYSVEEPQLAVLGVADAAGVVAWSHCWSPGDRKWLIEEQELTDVDEQGCRGNRPVPAGCEARGFSDALDWMLVECGPAWRLLPIGATAKPRKAVELARADDGSVTVMQGRSGLALAGTNTGLRLLAPDGRVLAQSPEVLALLPAMLGPELDRAVGRSSAGLEVFDLATGKRLATIALEAGVELTNIALAPDAHRLAWTDGHQITIHDLQDPNAKRSWDAGSVLGLAWRQDGAVLFSGAEQPLPERAWDPATGTLAASQPDPKLLRRLAAADLDPSWRWAFEGDDVLLRTLDGLALYLEDDGWVVTESGLHDGEGEPRELHVGVVDEREPRVLGLSSLPACRHPDLLEHFVGGVALPQPRLDPAMLAALERAD